MEIDNVGGLESTTAGDEMVEVGAYLHFVEEGGGVLEGQEPRVFDDGGEEDADLAFDRVDEALALELGGPRMLRSDADGIGSIGCDGGIVGDEGIFEVVEVLAELTTVSRGLVDEAGEAVVASSNVDWLEEIREELVNAFHVVVSRCAGDGREIGGCVGDERLGILGSGHGGEQRALCRKRERVARLILK